MGQSASIKDLKAQNTEFSAYLDQCTANLMTSAANDLAAFTAGTDSFYTKNNWDQQELGNGLNKNYQQVDEFSLDNVAKMVNAIAVGILGQSADPSTPAGSDVPAGTNMTPLPDVATAMLGFEGLAAKAAVSIITDILSLFTTKTTSSYSNNIVRQSLAPGLTLHLFAFDASFQQKGFFNNNSIIESFFSYKLIYSFQEGKTQGDVKYMQQHEQLIAKLSATQLSVQDKYDTALADSDGSTAATLKINNLKSTLDQITSGIEEYRTEIDTVTAKYPAKS
ncbi:hypothetical protein [Ferruginibacter sp. HRS2-29]|uniref:hypothetical protein n=1 Tax=Ferruginibacter sp. HRS2-29 TaxID=2487334 RepID=UPI0020CBE8F2|nr:hypothetical protein [Ferruginibacter sp. HRS2-29]MCP9752345.1 hypothetical protein [Ferruginibacter sp. HRS2-29]